MAGPSERAEPPPPNTPAPSDRVEAARLQAAAGKLPRGYAVQYREGGVPGERRRGAAVQAGGACAPPAPACPPF